MNVKDISILTSKVLTEVGLSSPQALDLLMGTAAQESQFQYIYQVGTGPGRSFWQVEPNSAKDNVINFLLARPELAGKIKGACDLAELPTNTDTISKILERNLAYAICMCRIKYYRVKDALPILTEHQAAYWKQHYNTPGGAGTVEQYLKNYQRFSGAWK